MTTTNDGAEPRSGPRALRDKKVCGLVLSGGGMRGAYAAGVIHGVCEILDTKERADPPFRIFSGTSIGAINAAYLAANTHRSDVGADGLLKLWTDINVGDFLQMRPFNLVPSLFRRGQAENSRSLLDPKPLEDLVNGHDQWPNLHRNIADGRTIALLVAALDANSGMTTVFAETAPGVEVTTTKNPFRRTEKTEITAEHLLASSAIPVLFPPRRIGDRLFFDGGLRFNTPISPAIRAGAEKLMVISLSGPEEQARLTSSQEGDPAGDGPGLVFLLGKLLNSLVVDPIDYDLQVLARTNELAQILEDVLDPVDLHQVQKLLERTRGAAYRPVETLVFRPTTDLGKLAARYLKESGTDFHTDFFSRVFLKRAAASDLEAADWATYLLFDGKFAMEMIRAGRDDAYARKDEVLTFFDDVS